VWCSSGGGVRWGVRVRAVRGVCAQEQMLSRHREPAVKCVRVRQTFVSHHCSPLTYDAAPLALLCRRQCRTFARWSPASSPARHRPSAFTAHRKNAQRRRAGAGGARHTRRRYASQVWVRRVVRGSRSSRASAGVCQRSSFLLPLFFGAAQK